MTEKVRVKTGAKEIQFDLKQIEEMASLGMPQEQIAYALGSCPATWFKYIAAGNIEIADAFKRGKGKCSKRIMNKLINIAEEGNPAALIFLAKAHVGLRENINLIHATDPDNPVQLIVERLSPEARKARLEELEKLRKQNAK